MNDEQLPEILDSDDHDGGEHAEQLFQRLAAEEPPLDLENDTAPSKTAPRPAVHTGDTQPIKVRGRGSRYAITLMIGMVLVITLVISILLLLQGNEEDAPSSQAQASTTPTQTTVAATERPTTVPTAVMPTEAPTVPFSVDLPPTAAVDEVSAWLLTPVGASGLDRQIQREEEAFTVTGGTARLEVEPYVVASGDTLTGISEAFSLEICSLVWSNPRNKVSPLRPGNTLDVPPVDGVLYKVEKSITIQQVADETAVSPFDIIDSPYNDLFEATPETVLVEGMKIVVPNGDGGNCNIWAPPPGSAGSGLATGGSGGGSLWGCSYTVDNPGFPGTLPVSGNYTFFQGFTAAHTGVDLSASRGTSVLASGTGTVAFAGWNEYGYGNAIVIDHGGTYTLYAHLSQINVSCGQSVGAGAVIGAVGSTGRSSGPHLHFEIRTGDFNPVDPTYSIRL